ncbi:hypothetical protein FJZ31_16470 [Candidatus Poribacteria bacterium]|nr:hypothetical protein [Candidatus Poribacteria bacterium]
MTSSILRGLLRPIPYILSDWFTFRIARVLSGRLRKLRKELSGEVTDYFLDILLDGMDLAFCLCKGYRKNIKNFEGRYLFGTADGRVVSSVIFKNGDMKTPEDAIDDWDVRVTFKDADALNAFIFSRDQDILNSLLANNVEFDGNVTYIFKFGFMARDLAHRFGIE